MKTGRTVTKQKSEQNKEDPESQEKEEPGSPKE